MENHTGSMGDPQEIFRAGLDQARNEAQKNNREIGRDRLEEIFRDSRLSAEQLDMVCTYLMGYGISVTGNSGGKMSAEQAEEALQKANVETARRLLNLTGEEREELFREEASEGKDGSKPDGASDAPEDQPEDMNAQQEDQPEETAEAETEGTAQSQREDSEDRADEMAGDRILEDYIREIDRIPELEPEKEFALFAASAAGNKKAKEQLTRAYLTAVCDMAGEYEGQGLDAEDLVQEANFGLLLALDHLEPMESLAAYRAKLLNEVGEYLRKAVEAADQEKKTDQALADRVGHLSDAIRELKEEMGDAVTVEDLAEYLNMSSDEIRDIMKLAGDDVKL